MKENTKIGIMLLLLLSGLGIAALFIVIFSELADEVMDKEVDIFDSFIINLLLVNESRFQDSAMVFITELGSVWFFTVLTIIALAWLWFGKKDRWTALFFVIAVAGGGLLNSLLKNLYGRQRPSINEAIDATGFSFPSGHAMGSLIFYGFVIFLTIRGGHKEWIKWTISITLSVLIALIGVSRIYLGAHFPSDVAAGFIAGTIWLLLCITALEWINWQSGSNIRPLKGLRRMLGTAKSKVADLRR